MPALVKLSIAASNIGITPTTLRHYVKQGHLSGVRINNRLFIEEAELRRFIEAGRSRTASESPANVEGVQ